MCFMVMALRPPGIGNGKMLKKVNDHFIHDTHPFSVMLTLSNVIVLPKPPRMQITLSGVKALCFVQPPPAPTTFLEPKYSTIFTEKNWQNK